MALDLLNSLVPHFGCVIEPTRRCFDAGVSGAVPALRGREDRFDESFGSMVTVREPTSVDEALRPALEAARKAEAASSFYQRTILWQEANFVTTQVIFTLTQQFPAQPPK